MGIKNKTNTLCWECKNACDRGCCWSDHFEPVPGWEAEYDTNSNCIDSYVVFSCPEFVRETPENKNRDLDSEGCMLMVERLLEITRDDYIKSKDGGKSWSFAADFN